MKSLAFTIGLALLTMSVPRAAWAQWTTGSGGAIYYNGGYVGIGTANPTGTLSVVGTGSNQALNVASGQLYVTWNSGAFAPLYVQQSGTGPAAYFTGGNVGIGTTNPQHLLQVAGTIGAQEILVTSTGADYVFEPGYRLKPLSEVAAYVEANHHLPDIPSAAEVKQKGMGVGEMESKLLAKVEELTLHMIAADERNSELESENRRIRDRMAQIEAQLASEGKGPSK